MIRRPDWSRVRVRRPAWWRRPAWLAEVAVQSVMIVLSILLALWVDQWKQQRAEHRLAIVSLSNFLKEVQQNQARLDDILPYHKGVRSMLAGLEASHSVRTPTDFQAAAGVDGMRPPFLLATAWQTAVATGALTHIDYETVSALSLTYTLQDRFREEGRSGMQAVLQASNFPPGHAEQAIHSADIYLRETIANEEELRATYAQAAAVLRRTLARLATPGGPPPDTASAADSTAPRARPTD
jgi:hypothetical protein